jgi:hypothetical protein
VARRSVLQLMAKLTLNDITTGFNSATAQNTNNALIETALENTISRDGSSPNAMSANLDMGSYEIVNVGAPTNNSSVARLQDVLDGADVSISTATLTTIVDSGGNFTSDNVEGALAELAGGTALPVASETAQGIVELATAAEAQALSDTTRAITAAGLATVMATSSSQGLVELATSAEVLAKDSTRAVTGATVIPAVTDYIGGRCYYLNTGVLQTGEVSIAGITLNTWNTFGPTGSTGNGVDTHTVWNALDALPTGCSAVILGVTTSIDKDATAAYTGYSLAASAGDQTDASLTNRQLIGDWWQEVANGTHIDIHTHLVTPVDANNQFRLNRYFYTALGSITINLQTISIRGFII